MIRGYLKSRPQKAYGKLNKEIIRVGTDILDATAQDNDVVIGKTFYARSGKHTGTLEAFKITLEKQADENIWDVKSLNFQPTPDLFDSRVDKITLNDNELQVGIDTSDGNITPQTVLKDYIGYAKKQRIVGELEAYQVEEQIIGENASRLIINKLQDTNSKDFITIKENIETMKAADYTEIIESGGILASDEEYEKAEQEFQIIAQKIMGVVS